MAVNLSRCLRRRVVPPEAIPEELKSLCPHRAQVQLSFCNTLRANLVEAYTNAFPAVYASAFAHYLPCDSEAVESLFAARAHVEPRGTEGDLDDVTASLCLYFEKKLEPHHHDTINKLVEGVGRSAHTMTILHVDTDMPAALEKIMQDMLQS